MAAVPVRAGKTIRMAARAIAPAAGGAAVPESVAPPPSARLILEPDDRRFGAMVRMRSHARPFPERVFRQHRLCAVTGNDVIDERRVTGIMTG